MVLYDSSCGLMPVDYVLVGCLAGFPSRWQFGLDALVCEIEEIFVKNVVLFHADVQGILHEFLLVGLIDLVLFFP